MQKEKIKKVYEGVVVSDKMDKSRVVVVETVKKHPLYGKFLRRRKKYMVHDEENKSKVGDRVSFVETRPISKRKKWVIQEILNNR
ncbi:MAG: 30S ribosomal protein S17 [Brevinematales bacterium]|nr:30S ribosomal protein S17 [Brevinematales bacterium]